MGAKGEVSGRYVHLKEILTQDQYDIRNKKKLPKTNTMSKAQILAKIQYKINSLAFFGLFLAIFGNFLEGGGGFPPPLTEILLG